MITESIHQQIREDPHASFLIPFHNWGTDYVFWLSIGPDEKAFD